VFQIEDIAASLDAMVTRLEVMSIVREDRERWPLPPAQENLRAIFDQRAKAQGTSGSDLIAAAKAAGRKSGTRRQACLLLGSIAEDMRKNWAEKDIADALGLSVRTLDRWHPLTVQDSDVKFR
jgi:hypothetical protein